MSEQPVSSALQRPSVLIIGGGLAGLAAATVLARQAVRVTLIESRPRLGGRASSIVDRETGQTIDNCQHVVMGCCTNFRQWLRLIDGEDLLERQPELYFLGPTSADRVPCVALRANRLPAPLHLAGSFARMPWLSLRDKVLLGTALRKLATLPDDVPDEPFSDWLQRQNQSPAAREHVWHTVLVSALSETLERTSLRHARKVFVDGFLRNRNGWEVSIPNVPLDEFYDQRVARWLAQHDVAVRLKCGAKQLISDGHRVTHAVSRSGEELLADAFILAVPQNLVSEIVPEALAVQDSVRRLADIPTAPIASVHLWFDRPLTPLPHAVLLGRLSQWVFNRGEVTSEAGCRFYYQVVISAAFDLASQNEADVITRVCRELTECWPEARSAQLLHGRMITEHRAVFSPRPGIEDLRPAQQSPIQNLQFAGDWTRTGWPSTMEGAVRSGFLAANNVLRNLGLPTEPLAADLPTARLSRWLFGLRVN